ncbi:MAG TPA: glycerophosphodiester phosphodiesterase [Gemmatimonadaceae bacterium]|nr:glycerophosphodiester phosphodiesterase [Gemmatimonadaceae bacterium]
MYENHSPPDAISHRGLHRSLPENSVAAFLEAIAAGADGVELDVHASLDDVLFVHHDAVVQTPAGAYDIARLESTELARLRLAGDHAVPTLDESLDAIGDRASVFIEVKARGIEQALTRCLRRHSDDIGAYAVHSFDHRIVKRITELIPSVRTGILQVSYLLDSCAVMRAVGATDLWQQADVIDASLVVDVHACGGRVYAWTANSETDWKALHDKRVDGICTDDVDRYAAWRAAARMRSPC